MTPSEESSSEEPDTLVGRVIANNFRIDRLIGSGATGHVYQAEQISLGKAVAVKILHPQLMADDKLVRRFQREAKSASRLNHANSVQIIESGQDATGLLFIAMELLSGRDLGEVIREEFPLPVPRIAHIMSQVLAALDEAHAQGIIHRDLKPSNIMLVERRSEPDFVKVCDYGIAKAASDDAAAGLDSQMLTVQGLVCGTPEYMSPEQARGEALDGRTDLYSAAVILYHLTTGDVPFRAATPIGIVSRHLSDIPAAPSSRRADAAIPPALDDLILRGLAKSRDLRPATAAIFREELLRIGSLGVGRRALASAQTLPATSLAANGGTTTAELVSPAPRKKRRVVAWGSAGASLGAVAVAIALRSGVLSPTAGPGPALATATTVAAPPPAVPPSTPSAAPAAEREEPAPSAGAPPAPSPGPEPAPASPHERSTRHRASAAGRAGRTTPSAPHPASRDTETAVAGPAKAAPTGPSAAARPEAAAPPDVVPVVAAQVAPAPTVRGPREMLMEGERLIAQGEIAEACRHGEDAKRAAPKLATVYKFLGKCYMRAGNPALGKEDYRRYLELAPNASDAVFIESIVKEPPK